MEYNQQYQCLRDFALKATKTSSGAINWAENLNYYEINIKIYEVKNLINSGNYHFSGAFNSGL